jgi:hypothetical protein
MRKYVLPVFFFFSPAVLPAQTNNSFDKTGIDYVHSIEMIRTDFNAGRATDFSEAMLSYYSAKIPLKNQVSVDMTATILNTMKSVAFNYATVIDNSSLSSFSRSLIKDIIRNDDRFDNNGYRDDLGKKTDQVLSSAIPAGEKEFVLSLVAVAYHIADPLTGGDAPNARERGCWINGPYGSGPGTQAQCIAAGALIGGVIGYSICGVLCGLGGAVIGGVAGALS